MWTEISYSLFLNIFQGPSGQRGPEGLMGKPGEDVSQPFDLFTPRSLFIYCYDFSAAIQLHVLQSNVLQSLARTVKVKLFSH